MTVKLSAAVVDKRDIRPRHYIEDAMDYETDAQKIARIRAEIAAGKYENEERLLRAMERMIVSIRSQN